MKKTIATFITVNTEMTPPLTDALRLGGPPVVHLVASTSGTDSDWVVKLIDVYPDEVPSQPESETVRLPRLSFSASRRVVRYIIVSRSVDRSKLQAVQQRPK